MSPFDRTIVHPSLCRVGDHIRRFERLERVVRRNFTPIECLDDDCLSGFVREAA